MGFPTMGFPAGPLWLIGCGNMGGAMLRRWIAAGPDPASVTVITRSGKGAPEGVRSLTALPDEDAPATLMLALKPQQIDAAQALLAPMKGAPKLLLSILAGVDHAALAGRFEADAIVRAMPNLPVAIGKGVTSLYTPGASVANRSSTPSAILIGPSNRVAPGIVLIAAASLASRLASAK